MESHLSGFEKIDPLGKSCLIAPKTEAKVKYSTHTKSTIDPIVLLIKKITKVAQGQNDFF